jgi:DNA repair protein RecN (Recombination protein N)
MLTQLFIKNFALIDELNVDFHNGFSVITGETGAGKSIILGALGMILGQRADAKLIKNGAAKCIVEAHFNLEKYDFQQFFTDNDIEYDASDSIIRREISAAGKSRAFVNDTPVQLAVLKSLGEQLVDIHSQHQNLLLQKEDFQLNVVDTIAQNQKELNSYRQLFNDLRDSQQALSQLKHDIEENLRDADYIRFQLQELEKAKLTEDLQEQLEQESNTLSHSEDIKNSLFTANELLNGDDNGIVNQIRKVTQSLHSIASVFPSIEELYERVDSSHIELKDIAEELSSVAESIEYNPARLEEVNSRLDHIYSLEQKFHVTSTKELLTIKAELESKISNIDNSDEQLSILQAKVNALNEQCTEAAAKLTATRIKAAKTIEKEMLSRLIPLGIPNVRFEVSVSPAPQLTTTGTDKLQFLFSANKNTQLQPVAQVASGGEIARVMLALKAMISGKVKLPTIIFDEIDTGVSGKIAQKMAAIMQEMGNNERQVISITHLPQIAALGTHHYKVYKEEDRNTTTSHIIQLSQQQRINEIAQMLSGDNITDAAITNAKELLTHK